MIISIITLFPELYTAFLNASLLGKAQERGILSFDVLNMLDVCAPKERVDGPTYGHYAGMILRPEVIERSAAVIEQRHGKSLRVMFSPRGKKLTQRVARELAERMQEQRHITFIAGRYEGIDARAEEAYADIILSVGDFVVMGGDIPAQLTIEAMARYIPGVIGKSESVERDSFTGPFVDCPAYTAPAVWQGREVPEVMRSGDHRRIDTWCKEYAVRESVLHHFDWVRSHAVTQEDRALIQKVIPPHYIALMHDDVLLPQGQVGTSSVTSIDIHDIARSAKTYGVQGFFIVTPLQDQQKIVRTLLEFWQQGEGVEYNPDRRTALATTHLLASFAETVAWITDKEGMSPIIMVTSARSVEEVKTITYSDQEEVWSSGRPVLIVLGTARGLAPRICAQAQYALLPLEGYTDFNHLSVRSAAAIILDRWLGIQIK